jgi:3-isopropylmalate/(R)-2-methylmalate dehydratase small subunit
LLRLPSLAKLPIREDTSERGGIVDSPIKGRVWLFGKDIDTDQIYPGRYLELTDPMEIASHAMEGVDPAFARESKPGDVIVADRNFGCGSSREHAAICLKHLGIACILAESFARIFFRNSVNLGIPPLICRGIHGACRKNDVVEIDLPTGSVTNVKRGIDLEAEKLPEDILRIIRAGGIISYFAKKERRTMGHVCS